MSGTVCGFPCIHRNPLSDMKPQHTHTPKNLGKTRTLRNCFLEFLKGLTCSKAGMHIDVPSFLQPSKELLQLGGKGKQHGAAAYQCMRLDAVDAGHDRHASTEEIFHFVPTSSQCT